MGELGLDLAQQGTVGVTHVLAALPGTTQTENRWSRLKIEVLEDRDWSVFADLVDALVSAPSILIIVIVIVATPVLATKNLISFTNNNLTIPPNSLLLN